MPDVDALLAPLARHGLTELNPGAEHVRALAEANRDGPLRFVNLLAYPRDAGLAATAVFVPRSLLPG